MKGYTRYIAIGCALVFALGPAAAHAAGTGDDPRPTKDRPTTATVAAERAYESWTAGQGGSTSDIGTLASDIPYEFFWTPTHLQERNYWCGPASVQIIDHYWGPTTSQAAIASWLGTTTSGTDFSLVDDALRAYTGRPYVYVGPLASTAAILSRIEYGLDVRKNPMVGDFNVSATWPNYVYSHAGHIIPIEAFDWRNGTIRLNDPYEEAYWMSGGGGTSGHKTYAKSVIATGIYNHWRRAVVY